MPCPSFSSLDAFKETNPFRGKTSSWFGVFCSLLCVIIPLALGIPLISAYLRGIQHQSFFVSQLPISTNLYIPDTFRTAIAFY